jgi:membrane protease YdiL (CAAX protease family)
LVVAMLAGALLFAVMLQAIWLAVTHARVNPTNLHLDWTVVALQFLTYVPVVPVLLVAVPWAARTSLSAVGVRPIDAGVLAAGLLGGLGMFAVVLALGALQSVVVHVRPEQAVVGALAGAHDPLLIVAFAVVACIIAPFVEELVFRGLLFNALRRYFPFAVAAPLSALLFAYAHGTPSALIPLWGGGIVLAYVYARTGALTASMLSHATFNTINVVLIVAFHQTS